MKKQILLIVFMLFMLSLQSISLASVFDSATGNDEYDKVLNLESGNIYTGSLFIGGWYNQISGTFHDTLGVNVKVEGNGAVIDLQGGFLCIQYTSKRLDITNCVIINGCVKYRGASLGGDLIPEGSVTYCTFYNCEDYAIRLHQSGGGVTISHNIVMDSYSTGFDFANFNSLYLESMPTGHNIVKSIFDNEYGSPIITENWSYFTDERKNSIDMFHYGHF